MTKSIEEQAKIYIDKQLLGDCEYCDLNEKSFIDGAKTRDAQWHTVVNELINYLMRIKDDPDFNFKGDVEMRISTKKSYAINALTKADQLLKEMGI